jgi:hypothetical protein
MKDFLGSEANFAVLVVEPKEVFRGGSAAAAQGAFVETKPIPFSDTPKSWLGRGAGRVIR